MCGTATVTNGFNCIPLSATSVVASGLQLRGIQYNYITPILSQLLRSVPMPNTSEVGHAGKLPPCTWRYSRVERGLAASAAEHFHLDARPVAGFFSGASYAATEGAVTRTPANLVGSGGFPK